MISLKRSVLAVLAATALLAPAARAEARDGGDRGRGNDKRFSRLAAEWWQWGLSAPTPLNPLIDETGVNCATGQPDDGPWFLAGTLQPGAVTRRCTVDDDRDLFFPVVNQAYFAFLNDAPETRTLDYIRSQVDCEAGSTGRVTVDGKLLPASQLVHEESIVFSVQLPTDNIFGLTPDVAQDLVLSPAVDQGLYVLLRHLREGHHTIHIESTLAPACGADTSVDVTYELTVR